MRGPVLAACCVVALACADGSSTGGTERCAPLAELSPLPSLQCREAADALAFEQGLRTAIGDAAGGLLVRVELGEDARVRTLCAVDRPGHWKERRALAGELAAVMQMPAGPACLAGKRLDLNRRAAKQAEIQRLEWHCQRRLQTSLETSRGVVGPQLTSRQWHDCIEFDADWVVVHERGVMEPLLFGKPEVVDPPTVRARDTASRCSRKHKIGSDAQVACIEAEGWERLD